MQHQDLKIPFPGKGRKKQKTCLDGLLEERIGVHRREVCDRVVGVWARGFQPLNEGEDESTCEINSRSTLVG